MRFSQYIRLVQALFVFQWLEIFWLIDLQIKGDLFSADKL